MAREPFSSRISGWGHHPVVDARLVRSEDLESVTEHACLTRGLGRSYGDASLPAHPEQLVAVTTLADRLLSFDSQSGTLRAEAGTTLRQINQLFLPRGWFTPVSPGTQDVTLGGMVAADIHGKNHHRAGCFGQHVTQLRLRVADRRVVECSPEQEPDLFFATIGGMGLTGHILEVECSLERIPSPWIWCESVRAPDLDSLLDELLTAARSWPYTVAWVDCLTRGTATGRGIVIKGRWATAEEAPLRPPRPPRRLSVPCMAPSILLSRPAVRLFNAFYYGKHGRKTRRRLVNPHAFFYPLDAIGRWNRLYGRQGFTQHQCVLPHADDHGPARRLLERVTEQPVGAYLGVMKDFGDEGRGTLSFPRRGISLALDIPVRPGRTEAVIDRLNEQVIAEGGRIYLAKDALTRGDQFRRMEPRLEPWQRVRKQWDPDGRLRSALSVRVLGDTP